MQTIKVSRAVLVFLGLMLTINAAWASHTVPSRNDSQVTNTESKVAESSGITPQGLPVLEVFFSEKEMPKEYTLGNMRLSYTDGTKVELHAKFKMRGATATQYSMKPSFNMKLRDEQGNELDSTLCGLRSMSSWILDAMAIDRIGMRNRVAFDVWNEFSRLPYDTQFDSRNGTIGQFIEVYINGSYKGIYCMTDRINRKLLNVKKPQIGGEADDEGTAAPTTESQEVTIRGVIYKHGTNSIDNQNSVTFSPDSTAYVIAYHDAWELIEPEDYAGAAAWAPLDIIYQNKNNYEWVKEHFFLEQLAEYQTFISAMSIEDNWGNKNSIISARNVTTDGNKHRFVYTPWDLDTSLGGSYNGTNYDGNYSNWTMANIINSSTMPVPFAICNKQSEYTKLLKETWAKGREGALSVRSIREKLYRYRDLFLRTGAWERETSYWATQKYQPPYVTDLTREIDLIIAWYENRVIQIDNYFGLEHIDAITDVCPEDQPDKVQPLYNIMGQPVSEPTTRGIYLRHGKKIILKP